MSPFFVFFSAIAVILLGGLAFLNSKPSTVANTARLAGPVILLAIGSILTIFGRGAIGIPLVTFGLVLWARNRKVRPLDHQGSGQKSFVRSAWLEMELDHDSGDIDGLVLAGTYEDRRLSDMNEEDLIALYTALSDDGESSALLEAYLDRRMPGWGANTQRSGGSGQRGASGSGPMTKEEAYQILGLNSGAGSAEIREAHRRLMKRVHPDSGGSTFLAARINKAKDTLLD